MAGLSKEELRDLLTKIESAIDNNPELQYWTPPADFMERLEEWQGSHNPTRFLPQDRRTLLVLVSLEQLSNLLYRRQKAAFPLLPRADSKSLNAPGSVYKFKDVNIPLSTEEDEETHYKDLRRRWLANHELDNEDADALYDYIRRRFRYQTTRLSMVIANNSGKVVFNKFFKEYCESREEFLGMQKDRYGWAMPIGEDPNSEAVGNQAAATSSNDINVLENQGGKN